MKNLNYDLIKLLLNNLDDAWRIEKHYLADAETTQCKNCIEVMKKIKDDTEKHIVMLRDEITNHAGEKSFN